MKLYDSHDYCDALLRMREECARRNVAFVIGMQQAIAAWMGEDSKIEKAPELPEPPQIIEPVNAVAQPVRRRRGTWTRTPEFRAKLAEAMRARWAKVNAPQ